MNFMSSIRFSVSVCAVLALAVSASAQTTRYVSMDGECGGNTPCYATIQAAVNASAAGDEIIVAPGTYAGFTNTSVNMLTVRSSGGRDVTTLDGGGTAAVITLGSFTQSHTTLQGFTITNGHATNGGGVHLQVLSLGASANIDDCIFLNNTAIFDGGAIGGSHKDLVITNCLFIGNSAGERGGAFSVHATAPSSSVHIADCDFQNNTAGLRGGAINGAINVGSGTQNNTLVGCTFEGNSAPVGGAIWVPTADATDVIDDCQFTNNTATEGDGGAIRLQSASGGAWDFITNCTFTSNSAALGGGGGVALTSNARMTGSTLTGNTAATGGGAALSGNATIDNCTIAENESTGDGGGVRLIGGSSIINSIVTGNVAGGNGGGLWLNQTSATACAISGNTAGNGGGLYMIGATATDCPITGNAATGRGGGVGAGAGASHLVNCEISTNTAGISGGGMYIMDAALVNLIDSTVCPNSPDLIDFHIGGMLMTMNTISCEMTCPGGGDPIGACCLPQGGCATLSEANCIAVGGTYQGDGTSCAKAECPGPQPTCIGDLNGDGVVDVLDLLLLLGAWGICR